MELITLWIITNVLFILLMLSIPILLNHFNDIIDFLGLGKYADKFEKKLKKEYIKKQSS